MNDRDDEVVHPAVRDAQAAPDAVALRGGDELSASVSMIHGGGDGTRGHRRFARGRLSGCPRRALVRRPYHVPTAAMLGFEGDRV